MDNVLEEKSLTHDQIKALKLSLYMTLKQLYDKWICTYNRDRFRLMSPEDEIKVVVDKYNGNSSPTYAETMSEFNNFAFVDSFYNYIGDKMLINPSKVYNIVKDAAYGSTVELDTTTGNYKGNIGVMEYISDICRDSNLLLLTLPVYNNYYSGETVKDMFIPQPEKSMTVGEGSTYLIIRVPQFSSMPNYSGSYKSDSFDIAGVDGKINKESVHSLFKGGSSDGMVIPAFGVTFAKQNQSFFKSIKVDMNMPKQTDFSIANTQALARINVNGSSIEPHTIAQDVYSVFSNYAYQCTVEMLGCMNIMVGMYFQLNNIPMFRGAYMIIKVEHRITNGDMTTVFTGIRISKNVLPYAETVFSFAPMYNELIKNYEELCPEEDGGKVKNNSIKETVIKPKSEVFKYKYYSTANMVKTTDGSTPYFKIDGDGPDIPYGKRKLKRNETYRIGDELLEMSKIVVLSCINKGYKGIEVSYDDISDFFEGNHTKYGFREFSIDDDNISKVIGNLETGVIVRYSIVNPKIDETKEYFAIWNGNNWVGNYIYDEFFPHNEEIWKLKGGIVKVYMYNDDDFEKSELFKKKIGDV